MKTGAVMAVVTAVAALALAGGWWAGRSGFDPRGFDPQSVAEQIRSLVDGRAAQQNSPATPVAAPIVPSPVVPSVATAEHAGHGAPAEVPPNSRLSAEPPPVSERRLLYYRNPMGLPDTSPVPKKDPMGMDYLPVYADEVQDATGDGTLKIAPDRVQMLGVRTEAAATRVLNRTIRAVGTIQIDERRLAVVAPKFDAWIETLTVDTTGAVVRRGQPLMQVYSPELVLAQQEYLVAWKSRQTLENAAPDARQAAAALAEGALQRLRNVDITGPQIERLQREGTATRTLTLTSPADGVVLEKTAVRGMRFMAGETLYRIAELSEVWLIADVFEQDLSLIQIGQTATVTVNAYPDRPFTGRVGFIYPTLNAETRTARVRVEMTNRDGLLRPALYAVVEFTAPVVIDAVLAVPESAVIDSGKRQVVLVERSPGRYAPHLVKVGARADGYVQVLEGVTDGEKVVVRANFLIDSESNLRAALGGFSQGHTSHGQ